MEYIQEFTEFIQSKGFDPVGDIKITDGKFDKLKISSDKGRKYSLSYRLTVDELGAVGQFKCWSEGIFYTWNSKQKNNWTEEQKKAWAEKKRAQEKEEAEYQERKINRLSSRLKRLYKNLPSCPENHPYLKKKQISADGVKYRAKDESIILPAYQPDGRMSSLQKIFKNGVKIMLKGGIIKDSYLPIINKGDSKDVICIVEGWATGKSVYEDAGFPVMVSWTANNIESVAKRARKNYPKANIILCADNDAFKFDFKKKPDGVDDEKIDGDDKRWEEWREEGILYNTGVSVCEKVAYKIKGSVIWPEFKDKKTKPTDFNDLHCLEGSESVKLRIHEAAFPSFGDDPHEAHDGVEDSNPLNTPPHMSTYDDYQPEETEIVGDFGLPFKVLGFNDGKYYYLPFGMRQIVTLSPSGHSLNNLLQLASLEEWEMFFAGGSRQRPSTQTIVTNATDMLMRLAEKRGVFQEENMVRGAGAWMDAGRKILHCGDIIYEDGVPKQPKDVLSKYVYISAPKLFRPSNNPLSNSEAFELRKICEMPTWDKKLSGSLLAGWLVVSSICSMISWRPHIWIRGEAESGKSTIIDKIIKPVLGDIALNLDGGTTEPAIRELMRYDGRPIIYDEAESRNQSQRSTMEGVLMLARKASSGATIAKFGQRPFKAQFCACFSAINPSIKDYADESRITLLVLKKNRKHTAQDDYDALLNKIDDVITPDFSSRLLARTVNLMPNIIHNISIFKKAVRHELKQARLSDQLAPMLAGLYSLTSEKKISLEDAQKWISEQDFKTQQEISDEPDYIKCISHLATSSIRINTSHGTKDAAIGELVYSAYKEGGDYIKEVADKALRLACIVVKNETVSIGAKSPVLTKIFKGTAWEDGWSGTLTDIPESQYLNACYFAAGIPKSRAVRFPIHYFVQSEFQSEMALEIDDETEIDF